MVAIKSYWSNGGLIPGYRHCTTGIHEPPGPLGFPEAIYPPTASSDSQSRIHSESESELFHNHAAADLFWGSSFNDGTTQTARDLP